MKIFNKVVMLIFPLDDSSIISHKETADSFHRSTVSSISQKCSYPYLSPWIFTIFNYFSISINSCSDRILIPKDLAFVSLLPASAPAKR